MADFVQEKTSRAECHEMLDRFLDYAERNNREEFVVQRLARCFCIIESQMLTVKEILKQNYNIEIVGTEERL